MYKLGDRVIYTPTGSFQDTKKAVVIELDKSINSIFKIKIDGQDRAIWARLGELDIDPEYKKTKGYSVPCDCGAHHTSNPNHHLDWCSKGGDKKYSTDPIKGWDANFSSEFENLISDPDPGDWTVFSKSWKNATLELDKKNEKFIESTKKLVEEAIANIYKNLN